MLRYGNLFILSEKKKGVLLGLIMADKLFHYPLDLIPIYMF